MGKSKKDKRAKHDVDSDSEGENMIINAGKNEAAAEDEPAATSSKLNKKKKKGKGKKIADDDSDDDIDILAKVGASDEDDVVKSKPAQKKKAAKPKMSAFSMLDMMSDDDDDDDDKAPSDSPEEVGVIEKPMKAKGGKKGKKEVVNDDDEDLDAVLAEINEGKEGGDLKEDDAPQPAKKSKEKKKKKKQKVEEEEDDIDAILASMSYTNDPLALPDEKRNSVDEVAEKVDAVTLEDDAQVEDGEAEGSSVKTKAQKKKEKREKERQKKKEQKAKGGEPKKDDAEQDSPRPDSAEKSEVSGDKAEGDKEPSPEGDEGEGEEAASKKKKDKKKKKTKEEKEEEERAKRKPGKAKLKAMQEALAALKEQEEKQRLEEEERERKEEEARLAKIEAERLEKEKKEKAKQKKKEREQRLKEEGKWLTDKQKADRRRAMQMLEMMKQQGIEVPQKIEEPTGEKKKRVVYEKKKKRPQQQQQQQQQQEQKPEDRSESPTVSQPEPVASSEEANAEEVVAEAVVEEKVPEVEEIKDDWDADSEDEKESTAETEASVEPSETSVEPDKPQEEEEESDEEEEEESEEESDEDDDEESSEEESEDDLPHAEKVRIRAQERIQKRQEENEKARTTDVLRSPVVCVLGHVDTGKTKILDKLRRTHVQDGEAGGITQQIGATNVPVTAIKRQTEMCKEFSKNELKLPGLLIIDTPGHESFSNLRSRGSSLCDIAILVVDIMHGLEPQTIESIQLLKKRKTPFVVALNKIDRLFQWKTNPTADVLNTLKKQQKNTKDEFDERVRKIVLEFAEQSLNVTLFYENKNPKEWISLVPTSAHTGDGMGNLMAAICEFSQTLLAKRLAYSNELQATVMEVKALPGLGTTIDVCLVNGKLREGQTIVVAGQEGPIVTQIRGLLIPPPMKELRVKNQYEKVKEMKAAHGVKIIAKDLEKALAGLPLYACFHPDEVEVIKEEVANQLKNALNSIKLSERGVFVQASTLGSLEALLEFLKTSKIPYAGIGIGPIHKKDVMRASVMIEHDVQYAVILAFDVKVEREAQELADSLGVRIFTADIIYHLFDRFMEYREQYKQRKKDEFRHLAVFPCKMRILPQFIFNSRDPIVMGISVEAGVVRQGTPICVPSKEFVELGRISSLEVNNKPIESARKGQDVCIKIDPVPGEAPKMFGRHFEADDMLMSSISRESIDALKDYFRDEMQKTDWQLMIELKKIFKIS